MQWLRHRHLDPIKTLESMIVRSPNDPRMPASWQRWIDTGHQIDHYFLDLQKDLAVVAFGHPRKVLLFRLIFALEFGTILSLIG